MNIKRILLSVLAASSFAVSVPAAAYAVPEVGIVGVCPNASALASYIANNYPGVLSIGGIRQDRLPDHPSGHAIDIIVGGNTALGNAIYNDIQSQSATFGVKYILWQVPSHYDHIHVTVY